MYIKIAFPSAKISTKGRIRYKDLEMDTTVSNVDLSIPQKKCRNAISNRFYRN